MRKQVGSRTYVLTPTVTLTYPIRHHNSCNGSNLGKIGDESRIPATSRINVEEIGTWGRQIGARLVIMDTTQWVAPMLGADPLQNTRNLIKNRSERRNGESN